MAWLDLVECIHFFSRCDWNTCNIARDICFRGMLHFLDAVLNVVCEFPGEGNTYSILVYVAGPVNLIKGFSACNSQLLDWCYCHNRLFAARLGTLLPTSCWRTIVYRAVG